MSSKAQSLRQRFSGKTQPERRLSTSQLQGVGGGGLLLTVTRHSEAWTGEGLVVARSDTACVPTWPSVWGVGQPKQDAREQGWGHGGAKHQ